MLGKVRQEQEQQQQQNGKCIWSKQIICIRIIKGIIRKLPIIINDKEILWIHEKRVEIEFWGVCSQLNIADVLKKLIKFTVKKGGSEHTE